MYAAVCMPRMYAADLSYKTNKPKLLRDVRLLRNFLDGKIPPITGNDGEQLKILISKCKKNVGISSCDTEMSSETIKSTIQTKLEFGVSDVSPVKTGTLHESEEYSSSVATPTGDSRQSSEFNHAKKKKHSKRKKSTKRSRDEYSSSSSSSDDDTRNANRNPFPPFSYFTGNPYSFPGQPQGYNNLMPVYYPPFPGPFPPYVQQGTNLFANNISDNLVQSTNMLNVPFVDPDKRSTSSTTCTVTSTANSSRKEGELWSNLNMLVTAASTVNSENEN